MSYSLPVSQIRQHCFCARIPWFNELLNMRSAKPLWVKQGESHHKRQTMLNRRRKLSRYGLDQGLLREDVELHDEDLGLHGICDAVIETEHAVHPLEFKLYGDKPRRGQIYQLVAYGILCEKKFGKPASCGYILFGLRGQTQQINFDEKIRNDVLSATYSMRQNLERSTMPDSSASTAQCGQCEYLNYCNDRE